jgi:hypothetical protein
MNQTMVPTLSFGAAGMHRYFGTSTNSTAIALYISTCTYLAYVTYVTYIHTS